MLKITNKKTKGIKYNFIYDPDINNNTIEYEFELSDGLEIH